MTSKHIAFITESTMVTALEQYRVCSPLNPLGLRLLTGKKQSAALQAQVDRIRAIVIQRTFSRNVDEFKKVLAVGKQNNIPVVLDLDDYLFELPLNHPERIKGIYADALLPLLNSIIQVDAVTVTTNVLKKTLLGINPSIYVLPNYLDTDLWHFHPIHESLSNRPVRIVFIGTPTHQSDIESINNALVSIANKYREHIEFMFIGTLPPTGLKTRNNVITQPNMIYDYRAYVNYVQKISADIAIAPLETNLFNQCKSAIKFFEYASLGLIGVYAYLDPYQGVIYDGKNGFLAKTSEDWISALSKLIENPMLRLEMAKNAQHDVKNRWLINDHLNEWATVYQEICTNKRQNKPSERGISRVLDLIQVQQEETEWMRAKRKYTAAKTIVQLRRATNQLHADVYQLQQEKISLEDQEQRHIHQLNYLRTERERLVSIIDFLRSENFRLSSELDLTKQEVVDYALSDSWKYTRPLRYIKRKLRGS